MQSTISLGARWAFPVVSPPVPHPKITINNGVIADIEANQRTTADVDLGDVALLPGLVNAHTHLEFSDLSHPLGEPGNRITDWIPQVIQDRLSRDPDSRNDAIQSGLTESQQHGTVALGEIATWDWHTSLGDPPLHVVSFLEKLGNRIDNMEGSLKDAKNWEALASSSQIVAGLSPHAPYSVHPKLLEGMIDIAQQQSLPVAMHMAESREELDWLQTGQGHFRELFERLDVMPTQPPQGLRPQDILQRLQSLSRVLVIHGNYLTLEELDWIAQRPAGWSVVYCPRTHSFFQHEPYPLADMLQRQIRVAVGTDSRASNPDLSVWRELQEVARLHPQISPVEILKMGTLYGAQALGVNDRRGSLEVGKSAQLLSLSKRNWDIADPTAELFAESHTHPQPIHLDFLAEKP